MDNGRHSELQKEQEHRQAHKVRAITGGRAKIRSTGINGVNTMKTTAATTALLLALAVTSAQAQTQEPTTAPPDSTTGSSIRWEGRKFEPIYQTPSGGLFLARTNRQGIYYRKFIKDEPTTNKP